VVEEVVGDEVPDSEEQSHDAWDEDELPAPLLQILPLHLYL